jgi:2-C-methyl-D-erythritol 4-phosphate cytidylyltransferase
MGGALPKQFMILDGMPIVARTINTFAEALPSSDIVVVLPEEHIAMWQNLAARFDVATHRCVAGGKERFHSVKAGIEALDQDVEYVAIHDGARCLVTPEMIKKVFSAAYRYGAATAAKHASDTIKRADKNGFICETVDRSVLWHAQTPQVFKANIYRAAAYIAKKQGDVVTDDCMLAENLGFKVKLVDCTNENIKLTTYDDLYVAEAILRLRRDRKAREKAENGGKK